MDTDATPIWRYALATDAVHVVFTGRGLSNAPATAARRLLPRGVASSWLEQVHSSTVVDARPGPAGRADAMVTDRPGLALVIVTADCVPVLLASSRQVAAVHAGWRGIVGGVVDAAVARLAGDGGPIAAWIGPAIGACCYEVGEDVAARVVAASQPTVERTGPSGLPHVDLAAAVRVQLERAAVRVAGHVERCTRCHPHELSSYRRQGPRAGRNLSCIWRQR